jgi:multisubunit Na+/H+ antiporter MnhC subunit
MEFLEKMELPELSIGLFIAFAIGHFIIQRQDNLKLTLQYRLILYGIVMFILLLSLPRSPWVASISSHMDLSNDENKERFLNYLQKSNDTVDRIIDIVHFMIFITVFWFVYIISSIIKHFKLDNSVE